MLRESHESVCSAMHMAGRTSAESQNQISKHNWPAFLTLNSKNVRRTEYPALSSKSELWSNIYSQIRKSSVAANAFRHINQARSGKKKTVQSVAVSVSSTFRLRGIGAREYTWKKIWAGIVE